MKKDERRDCCQSLKVVVFLICLLLFNFVRRDLMITSIDLGLMLVTLVVVPSALCSSIVCTKGIGFVLSLWCFLEIFVICELQPEFGITKGHDDIYVSYAVVLSFALGIFGYFITILAFFCQRAFSRKVFAAHWAIGMPSHEMYMPNRSFCEFITCEKSDSTRRMEINLIRQF